MINILLIDNDGAGFADRVQVDNGTTIASFVAERYPNRAPGDTIIRVNRDNVSANYVLQDGDKVSMTPTKIDGA